MRLLTFCILLALGGCATSQAQTSHHSKFNWHLDLDRSTKPPTLQGYCIEYYWRDNAPLVPHEWVCYEVEEDADEKTSCPAENLSDPLNKDEKGASK